MPYLVDHPNPNQRQFLCPRRDDESGVFCVHTAENTPDFVAFDGGAEAVARFISTRSDPGSYHDLVDSDSSINLVDYGCEAFHVARDGFNRHAYGISAATRADVWPLAPETWKNGCTRQMAAACARQAVRVRQLRGIIVPARRITRAQALARVPGFVSHAELDPTRRTDPGRFFPWPQFLAEYARLTADLQEDDMTPEQAAQLTRVERMLDQRTYSATESALHDTFIRAKQAGENSVKLLAQQAALSDAVAQLGAGGSVDYGRVQEAAEAAVKATLGGLDED
jgi:N-acetyl-anhydromuramyl-L-alanine amidase AmpD